MGRHPLGGRNWEGFGPDPYLAGATIAASVRGVQEQGVQTCSKHLVANEQETQRSNSYINNKEIAAISSNIDDRTLHELYLWPFWDAVKAGTTSVMCSYNRVNQTYACENDALLNRYLKKELGFRGYAVSDWWATHSTIPSANNGLDLEMPGRDKSARNFQSPTFDAASPDFGDSLLEAVKNGNVSMDRLNDMVTRVLGPYFLLGQDQDYPTVDPSTEAALIAHDMGLPNAVRQGIPLNIVEGRDVRANHSALIRKIAAAGTVLLKNTNNVLPLQSPKHVAVFGNDAADIQDGALAHDAEGYDIGNLYIGGGSGTVDIETLISPLEAIKTRVKQTGGRVKAITNNTQITDGRFYTLYPLPDVCLVFLKTWATEGLDRRIFELDHRSTDVVNNIASWCSNTIVITHSAGVNTMPWAHHENVTAILAAHYPGEQAGNSIVDVLWGDVNPSGRLPYTIPESEQDAAFPIVKIDNPNLDPNIWQADFKEGQMIDYRHYDEKNVKPLYEFGFGLSYTTFDISSSLTIRKLKENLAEAPDATKAIEIGGNPELWEDVIEIEASISNTGSRPGDAITQLYVSFPPSAPEGTPYKALRGFQKVSLASKESKSATFKLKRRDVSYWDVVSQTWKIPEGDFTFRVGFSSRDLKAEKKYTVRS
jgi:beta-glucosidase